MKNIKQIVSIILLIAFMVSTIFNVLFLLDKIDKTLLYAEFFILFLIIFLISVFGVVLKNIRKDEYVTINILTPAKEAGPVYAWLLMIWAVTYFITIIFK